MTDLKTVFSHSPDIVTRKTGSEYVLVPVANNIADMNSVYTLNETGAFIWELIDGSRNVEEIINTLVEEYNIEKETATIDIFEFAENLKDYLIIK
ncbi:MAG: PqqD family protein [Bacteroidales bacterium]